TETYPLSLHDALPISARRSPSRLCPPAPFIGRTYALLRTITRCSSTLTTAPSPWWSSTRRASRSDRLLSYPASPVSIAFARSARSEEHTSELQSPCNL